MLKLPFNVNNNTNFLVINLDASELRCLAIYKDEQNYKIIGSGISVLEEGAVRNGNVVDLTATTQALEELVHKTTLGIEKQIKDVIIGISSDLCLENVTTAKITRSIEDEEITRKEYAEYQERIIESAYKQIQLNYAKTTGATNDEFELITTATVFNKIDSKAVDSVVGKTGKIAEVALYNAFCPTHHLKNIKKIFKSLKLNLKAITPQTFALLKALKETQLEHTDLVTIQMENDYTSVNVIFGGAIIDNRSLHVGYNSFVYEIAKTMGLSLDDARKVLSAHAKNELSQSESVMVQNCLKSVLDIWLEGLALLFKTFPNIKTFANKIYLYGKGMQMPEIEETLTEIPWTKAIQFKAPPEFEVLDFSILEKIMDATGEVNNVKWLPTTVLSYIYEELIA